MLPCLAVRELLRQCSDAESDEVDDSITATVSLPQTLDFIFSKESFRSGFGSHFSTTSKYCHVAVNNQPEASISRRLR